MAAFMLHTAPYDYKSIIIMCCICEIWGVEMMPTFMYTYIAILLIVWSYDSYGVTSVCGLDFSQSWWIVGVEWNT